jgi:predicted permease
MISAFWPIWLLATAGYLARSLGLLGARASSVLGWFVFHVAMPVALFVTLARTHLAEFDAKPLIAFAAGTTLIVGVGWYAAGRLFGRKPAERAIWGMAASYVNSANLGIPIALRVLGNVSFLVQVVLLQVLVVTPVILITLDRHASAAGRIRLRRIATLPFRNPVILGSALGVGVALAGVNVPPVLLRPLTLVSATAVPAALVALGASLRQDSPASATPAGAPGVVPRVGTAAELGLITALKLVGQPAVALAAGALLRLTPSDLLAVVVCAGLPTAQNTFIFAGNYGVAESLAGRAVLVTTTLSLASLAAWAAMLGR